MAAPSLSTEVNGAGEYPSRRFNQRERRLLESVKTYADSISGTPAYVVKYAGTHTSTNNATNTITVTGVAATDLVFVQLKVKGASPVTILTAAPTTNTITVVFSGAPSTDHVLVYQVLRAVS
jgi:hypothetical protein